MDLPRERLRRRHRPDRVRLLFIGEAPPASGRFFYQRDSGLYRAMLEAFHSVDPAVDECNFLALFQTAGCYLIDLCPQPVDHLPAKQRRSVCHANQGTLARAIARLQPAMIATVVRSIEGNVAQAAAAADWQGPYLHLPYPGRWSRFRRVFIATLTPVIKSLTAPA